MITLILSDVIGDDLDVIASGPTVGDRSTFSDCLSVIEKYSLASEIPSSVLNHLRAGKGEKDSSRRNFFNRLCIQPFVSHNRLMPCTQFFCKGRRIQDYQIIFITGF